MEADSKKFNDALKLLKPSIVQWCKSACNSPDTAKTARLIDFFLEKFEDTPGQVIDRDEIWEKIWPEDFASPTTTDTDGSKVRTTICRANKAFAEYFAGEGRKCPFRFMIQERKYRIRVEKNILVDVQPQKPISTRKSNTLGLLCSRTDWFSSELIAGALTASAAANHHLAIAIGAGELQDEQQSIAGLKQCTKGMIVVPVLDEFARDAPDLAQTFHALETDKYPFVFADHPVPGFRVPLIASDNVQAGRMGAEGLISELECEEVHILAEPGSQTARELIEGALQYAHGAGAVQSVVKFADMPGELGGAEFAHNLTHELLEKRASRKRRIGIFATDDRLAEGARATLGFGECRKFQESVFVLGFGGQDFGFGLPPKVSIRQDFYKIGMQAVEVLLQVITERREGFGRPRTTELSRRIPVELSLNAPDYERLLSRNLYREKRPQEVRPPLRPGAPRPPGTSGGGRSFGHEPVRGPRS